MAKFEVGKIYESYAREYDPVVALKRTDKTLWVKHAWNDRENGWRMRIRVDADGNEFCVDSSVPPRWRDAFTYSAEWVYEEATDAVLPN